MFGGTALAILIGVVVFIWGWSSRSNRDVAKRDVARGAPQPSEDSKRRSAKGPKKSQGNPSDVANAESPEIIPERDASPASTSAQRTSDRPGKGKSTADVIEDVRNGIVLISISNTDGREIGLGTGFIVDDSGLVATNFHVMSKAHRAKAQFYDGSVVDIKGYRAFDEARDLAIVELAARPPVISVLKLHTEGLPRQGSDVIAIGHPSGFKFTTTTGIVSGVHTTDDLPQAFRVQEFLKSSPADNIWIQTNAAISGGNSGGPLLSMEGEVLGINTWVAAGQNLGFATHARHVAAVLSQLKPASLDLAEVNFGRQRSGSSKKFAPQTAQLLQEFNAAYVAFQDELKALSQKGGSQQQFLQIVATKNPAPIFVKKFFALADEHRKQPLGLESLGIVCHLNLLPGSYSAPAFKRATAQIIEDHLNDAALGELLFELRTATHAGVLDWLLEVTQQAKDPKVCGPACYARATALLHAKSPATEPKREAEAVNLLQRVLKEFAEVSVAEGKLGELADPLLFEIQYLAVGKQPPDIVGTDLSGQQFKLSEFRGKVVVIDIFADWCPHCSRMYPEERALVERLKDKPFVLVGVNVDQKERLKQLVETGQVTWRCWWDGPDGPLARRWNVDAYPTIFVLDQQGVIRHRFSGAPGSELNDAVEQLLAGNTRPLPSAATPAADGDLDAQLENLAASVDTQPANVIVNVALSLVSQQRAKVTKKHLAMIVSWAKKGLEAEPDSLSLQTALARLYTLQESVGDAVKLLRKLLEREGLTDPQVIVLKNQLASLLVVQDERPAKNAPEALQLIQDAIRRGGETPDLLDTRGMVYLAQSKLPPARADLRAALEKKPAALYYFHLALVESKAKSRDATATALQEAVSAGLTLADLTVLERKQFEKLAKLHNVEIGK